MGNFLHVAKNTGRNRTSEPGGDGAVEKLPGPGLGGGIEFGPVLTARTRSAKLSRHSWNGQGSTGHSWPRLLQPDQDQQAFENGISALFCALLVRVVCGGVRVFFENSTVCRYASRALAVFEPCLQGSFEMSDLPVLLSGASD